MIKILLLSIFLFAAEPIKVKKGASITVEEYDPKMNIFVVSIQSEAVGPNYVLPEELKKAIDFEGTKTDFMNQKAQMIKSVYQLKAPLTLLSEDQVLKKAKAAVKSENQN